MANTKKPAATPAKAADDAAEQSKAAQEREAYFYANHRPPAGYQSRIDRNRLIIEPIRKKG